MTSIATHDPHAFDGGHLNLLPTLPGFIDGIVGEDPVQLQCSQCGAIETPAMLVLQRTHFHSGWDGRWCPVCRLAQGCTCDNCSREISR